MTASFSENQERPAGRNRHNFIDMHGCYLLNEASSNEEEGPFCVGDELEGARVLVSCVPLELGSILDRENQRDTEEDRRSGGVRTRGEAKSRGGWRDLTVQDRAGPTTSLETGIWLTDPGQLKINPPGKIAV
jgi:hypothetical protein